MTKSFKLLCPFWVATVAFALTAKAMPRVLIAHGEWAGCSGLLEPKEEFGRDLRRGQIRRIIRGIASARRAAETLPLMDSLEVLRRQGSVEPTEVKSAVEAALQEILKRDAFDDSTHDRVTQIQALAQVCKTFHVRFSSLRSPMNPFSSHYARRSEPSKGTPPEESATQASLKIIRDYFPFFKRHKAFKDLLRSVGTAKLLLALDKCPMSLAEVTFFDLCHVIGENLQDPEIAMESLSFLEELEVELGFSTSLRRTAAKLRFKITGAYPLSDLARGGLSSSALSVLLDESLREGALRAIEVVLRSANGPDKRAMRAEGLASIREYYAAAAESLFLQEIDDVLENLFVFARLAEAFHLHLADVDVVRNPSTPGAGS